MAASDLSIECEGRWLVARFGEPHTAWSWAIVNGGRVETEAVAWYFLRAGELTEALDPETLLREALRRRGLGDAVGLLTSRRAGAYVQGEAECEGIRCHTVATVGLSNALRAGDPLSVAQTAGTINALCRVSVSLTAEAGIEALAVAAEARTAAVLESGTESAVSRLPATGTGTDCIVVAHPNSGRPERYAGKHTAIGHVIGLSVYDAVRRGAALWHAEQNP